MHVSKLLTLPDGLYKLSKDRKIFGITFGKKKLFYLNVTQGSNFFITSEEEYHGFNYYIPCYSFKVVGSSVVRSWYHNSFRFVAHKTLEDESRTNFSIMRYIESATHLEYIGP